MDLPIINFILIGQKIRKAREGKQFSQVDLSKITQLTQPHIHRIEIGDYRNLTIRTLIKIAFALDIPSLDSIVFDEVPVSKMDQEFLTIIKGLSKQEQVDALYFAKCLKDRKKGKSKK